MRKWTVGPKANGFEPNWTVLWDESKCQTGRSKSVKVHTGGNMKCPKKHVKDDFVMRLLFNLTCHEDRPL